MSATGLRSFSGTSLDDKTVELINLVISDINACKPCTSGHVDKGRQLGLSDDEVAFIGAATFETRKQFGRRTSLSLVTDYEWYSFAPEMQYVNADRNGCEEFEDGPRIDCPGTVNRTHISDDDAFAVRTTLRLNIGLGSSQLYAETLK